ncbi:hypothetical protein [Rhodococcus sp. KRD162]|uniref:hypothetical protein n=1 Tax=Rhodococcus sp. KRD162 TaxID=2729725 RepID=UPI0019D0A2F1|nr:hypothetical protein [Rhodococcus sp. KRD162]
MADRPALTNELWNRLTEALGLPEDADAETVVSTVEDLVTKPEPKPEEIAAAAGLTPTVLTQLRHDAEQGRILAAAETKRKVTEVVHAALGKGKITPARVSHWVTMIEADPTMADTLASIPDEFAVPINAIGHGVGGERAVAEEAEWFR